MADMTQAEVNSAVNSLKAYSVETSTRLKAAMNLQLILVNMSDVLAQNHREQQRGIKLITENAEKAIVSRDLDQEIKDKQEKVNATIAEVDNESRKLVKTKRAETETQVKTLEVQLQEKEQWASYKIKEIEAGVAKKETYSKELDAKIAELRQMAGVPICKIAELRQMAGVPI